MEFAKEGAGEHREAHGTTRLYVDDEVVARARCARSRRSSPSAATASASAATPATPVSKEYTPPARSRAGRILEVEVNVGDDRYVDLEQQAAAMMARE